MWKKKPKPYVPKVDLPFKYSLIGNKYGCLTVVSYVGRIDKRFQEHWLCSCVCGNTKAIIKGSLVHGLVRSCGCRTRSNDGKKYAMNTTDLIGMSWGYLTVIAFAEIPKVSKWLCRCKCGNITTVSRSNIIAQSTFSCGCFKEIVLSFKLNITKRYKLEHNT